MTTRRTDPDQIGRARALIDACAVWDNHGCMPVGRPHDSSFLPQLKRYRRAGVDAIVLNVGFGEMTVADHVSTLAAMRAFVLAHPQDYLLFETLADLERARATERLAVAFDIEGAKAIDDQLSLLELYRALGVRWMLVAYNRNNRAGGGCQDDDGGLTGFGREMIAEMERIGLQVCCSHTGHRTVRDVLKLATKPVILSHSLASAVHPHPRNVPDDLIAGIAATGGTIGLNGLSLFLGAGSSDDLVSTFVRHYEHVAAIAGTEHVALGLDYVFDTAELEDTLAKMKGTFPPGLGYDQVPRMIAPEQLVEIVSALMQEGHEERAIRGLLGDNLVRVARSVWPCHEP